MENIDELPNMRARSRMKLGGRICWRKNRKQKEKKNVLRKEFQCCTYKGRFIPAGYHRKILDITPINIDYIGYGELILASASY